MKNGLLLVLALLSLDGIGLVSVFTKEFLTGNGQSLPVTSNRFRSAKSSGAVVELFEMIQNFFVLYESNCIFNYNFSGVALEISLITGFSSAVSTFTKFVKGTRRQSGGFIRGEDSDQNKGMFTVDDQSFLYIDVGDFTLLAHTPMADGEELVYSELIKFRDIIVFFFGPVSTWTLESLQLNGFQDVVASCFSTTHSSLTSLVQGIPFVLLLPSAKQRLDEQMSSLEEHEDLIGSMLILGNSVLHSRLPKSETRMALDYHMARPLGPLKLHCTPVFSEGQWKQLLLLRLGTYYMAVMFSIHAPFAELVPLLDRFEASLASSEFELPLEEPPIRLRQFTGHDALAFVFKHKPSDFAIGPNHTGSGGTVRIEYVKLETAFAWFLAQARKALGAAVGGTGSVSTVSETALVEEEHTFYARSGVDFELYVLFSHHVNFKAMHELGDEIVNEAMRCFALPGDVYSS